VKLLPAAAVFVAVAALSHVALVAALPTLINAWAMHKLAGLAGGVNRALAAPRPDADSRTIVRLSPDLLYTMCVFDISERPLRITAPVPDSYVSISGFAANTDNFFAVNDASVQPGPDGRKVFDVVLARSEAVAAPPGARVIVAPSDKGVILFRSLITSDAALPGLRDFQARQDCRPL
jgi:uncharacterized membrane protein